MSITYPPRIPIAQLPTPIQFLERLTKELGGPRLYAKRDDLTGSVLSGNKVRKLEFSIAEARAQGCDTLITCGGVQSNHCRATVLAGAQLGMKVHLVLRGSKEDSPDGNLFLDYLGGAEISYYPREVYGAQRPAIFAGLVADYAAKGRKAFCIPTGASDGIGAWGYIRAAEEMKGDFERLGISPTHIVCASGSGGTQAGLTLGAAIHGLRAQVVAINICDDEAYFRDKVRTDMREWKARYKQPLDVDAIPITLIDGHVGPGYAMATPDVFETIARVARLEGLVLDPVYTGKAFNGLVKEIAKGRFTAKDTIVFVHTGGVFGLLAQRANFGY
jgi:D-cysteine desulfhydrase